MSIDPSLEKLLEKDCKEILGWTVQKIARSRPHDLLLAMNEYKEQQTLILSPPPIPTIPISTIPISTIPISTIPVSIMPINHIPTPILTNINRPNPSTVQWEQLLRDGNTEDLLILINAHILKLHKYDHRAQNKQNLFNLKYLDLLDELVLRDSMERDTKVICRLTTILTDILTGITQSIQMKQQLLAILQCEQLDDDVYPIELDTVRSRLAHLERCYVALKNYH